MYLQVPDDVLQAIDRIRQSLAMHDAGYRVKISLEDVAKLLHDRDDAVSLYYATDPE